jgi:sulfur carrier protein
MKVIVNGKTEDITTGISIGCYLVQRGINPKMVVVEYNYTLPSREEWDRIPLNEDDNLEVIKMIGGG